MGNKITKRTWLNIILFSLMGGLAWNVENMYFNTFLFESIYEKTSPEGIMEPYTATWLMVAFSAVTAVVTTFIMGALSEKMKKRKVFISIGYIAWGIVTASFGFISKENVSAITGITDEVRLILITAWIVIVMDMIMTFMGSTSNDSAFNAWVTDVSSPENRPKIETVLTFVGVFALLPIVVALGMSQSGDLPYSTFFFVLGAIVTMCGVSGLFLLQDPPIKVDTQRKSTYWSDLFYGFRPSVVKENSRLYTALTSVCFYNIAVQVFFPYLFIYLGSAVLPYNENVDLMSPAVLVPAVIAVVVLLAGIIILLKVSDKNKFLGIAIAVGCFIIGLVALSTSMNIYSVIVGIGPTLIGYVVLMIQLNASVRDFIPQDKVGLFQGIRMIFVVLIPMVVGPFLGRMACLNSNLTYEEFGRIKTLPSPSMFFYAAIVAVLVFVPLYFLKKKGFKVEEKEN